ERRWGSPWAYFLRGGASLRASGLSAAGGGTRRVQVSPPSCETCSPLPGPPLVRSQGIRRVCQVPAKRVRGLFGSKQTSEAPASGLTKRTRFHVLPPSVVR